MGTKRPRFPLRGLGPRVIGVAVTLCLQFGVAAQAQAAITSVGGVTAQTGSGASTVTLAKPAGSLPGQLMVVMLQGTGSTAIPTPSGWNVIYALPAPYGYTLKAWKVVDASDPSSFTFDLGTSRPATASLETWHGVDPSNPIDTFQFASTGSTTTSQTPSVTTTVSNAIVVQLVNWGAFVTSTAPPAVTLLGTAATSGGSGLTSQDGYISQPIAGATPAETFTASASAASGTGAIALRPDVTAPAAPTITPPSSPGSSTSPSWTFTTDDPNATFECKLARGSTVISAWAACTSPQSYGLTGDPDGTYTISVYATDEAGNVSSTSTSDYTLDTTPPAAPTITPPSSPSNSTSPSWSFTDEPGAAFQCELTSGATVISGWAACTSAHSYDLTGEPDGTYTFSVKATDQAGNTGSPSTSDYRLDTTPPAVPTITPPSSPSNSTSPSWSFTDEPGATFQCELTSGATVVYGWASCTSAHSYDLTGEPDATYTFSVKATDQAGNSGSASTSDYALDTTPPAAPTITASPVSPGSSRSPAWSFTGEAGTSFKCELTRGGTVVFGWSSCASAKTYDLTGRPDGTYAFSVEATDQAGNQGPASTASDYALDTTAPAAPTITSSPPSPGSSASPSWSFTDEPGSTFECQLALGGAVVSGWSPCTSAKTYDLTGRPDGTYTFQVRASDTVGNTGPASTGNYTLTTAPPGAPTITSTPGPVGNGRAPSWGFAGDPFTSFECELTSGATVIASWSTCASRQSYNLAGLPDGTYTFSVRASNVVGAGAAASSSYVLDTTPPGVPTIISSPGAVGRNRQPAWGFLGDAGAGFQCQLSSGSTVVRGWTSCASPDAYDLTGLPEGAYTFTVRAVDGAGNLSGAASDSYQLDTTPPRAPLITSGPGAQGTNRTPRWSFKGEAGATFECRLLRGGVQVNGWSKCSSARSYDLSQKPDGDYLFEVRAVDAAGNVGPSASSGYRLTHPAGGGGSNGSSLPSSNPPPSSAPTPGTPAQPHTATHAAGAPSLPTSTSPSPANPPPGHALPLEAVVHAPRLKPLPQLRRRAPGAPRSHGGSDPATAALQFLWHAVRTLAQNSGKAVFPGILVLIVFVFLSIQRRIDLNDPKLALAPQFADPALDFGPPPSTE